MLIIDITNVKANCTPPTKKLASKWAGGLGHWWLETGRGVSCLEGTPVAFRPWHIDGWCPQLQVGLAFCFWSCPFFFLFIETMCQMCIWQILNARGLCRTVKMFFWWFNRKWWQLTNRNKWCVLVWRMENTVRCCGPRCALAVRALVCFVMCDWNGVYCLGIWMDHEFLLLAT